MASCKLSLLRTTSLLSRNRLLCHSIVIDFAENHLHFYSTQQLQNPAVAFSVSDFLQDELGLSHSQIVRIQERRVARRRTESIQKCTKTLALLKDYNFSDSQVRKIILRNSDILHCRENETLKCKLDYIRSLGFTEKSMQDVVVGEPRILSAKDLAPRVQKIEALMGGPQKLLKALKRHPRILICSCESIDRKIELFRKMGWQDDAMSCGLLSYPSLLTRSEDYLKMHMEFYMNLGVSRDCKTFLHALGVTIKLNASSMEERAQSLKTLGLGDAEAKELIRKYPEVLAVAFVKKKKIMDYLFQRAGLSANCVFKYPRILASSLERRIIPRHAVFRFLSAAGISGALSSLPRFIMLPESTFMDKYVKGNPHGEKIVQVYREAMNSIDLYKESHNRPVNKNVNPTEIVKEFV